MPHNTLPSGIHDLLQMAAKVDTGLARLGPWIRLTQMPPATFHARLTALEEAEARHARAQAEKFAASRRAVLADAALTAWLGQARLVVMLARGAQWSPAWIEAGFTTRGTNVPKRMAARAGLAHALVAFFKNHAELEVVFAEVTAAHGTEVLAGFHTAQSGAVAANVAAGAAKRARDAAETTLRRTLRQVMFLIEACIGASDERWTVFGLRVPRPAKVRPAALPAPPPVIALPTPFGQPMSEPRAAAA